MRLLHFFIIPILIAAVSGCTGTATPQGPDRDKSVYGPIDKAYELPKVKGAIYFVSPDGQPESVGTSIDSPTTIEAAIERVVTGDAIVMRGGVYRTGNLTFNQSITIQPYRDEKPVLNGTLVATDWNLVNEGLWFTSWEYLFPEVPEPWWHRDREEQFTPLHRFNNDGIFVDGQYLQSVGSKDEVDENTYYVDYDKDRIYIGVNPADRFIEITAFRKAIFRTIADVHGKSSDGRGPIIRGLTITQYPDTMVHIDGYYPQGISNEEDHGKDVVGTVFENCTFSKSFRIGVFAIGDSMVMRNCKIIDTNTEGLYVVASSDVLLERNIFAHNNIERWTGFYPAAVKIFNQSHRVVCRGNLVIDHPYSNGIWYDVGNNDGVFVDNWVERVGRIDKHFDTSNVWPSDNGFFFEISNGAICAGNVFVDCDQAILILNANNVEIYNNTFINSVVSFGRNSRGDHPDHFGWHPDTGPGVEERDGHTFVNNLFYMDENNSRPMLIFWQPPYLCQRLSEPQLKALDYNVFVRETENDAPIIHWSPIDNEECTVEITDPKELNKVYPNFSMNSTHFPSLDVNIFMGFDRMDYRLTTEFAKTLKGDEIPKQIRDAARWSGMEGSFVGAYPTR